MLSTFQTRFQDLEQSLTTLIDSITAYNPSIPAASSLITADDQLTNTVSQLSIHHANYTRILSLRATANSLDEKIKTTLRNLADTRKELLAIPSALPAESNREVSVDELLSYAKFIARTTVPPTYRRPIPTDLLPSSGAGTAAAAAAQQPLAQVDANANNTDTTMTQITNGMATPAQNGETNAATTTTNPTPETGISSTAENHALSLLPQETKDQLNLEAQLDFTPWPSHEVIRMGALASVQLMLEDGVDPTTVLSKEEQEKEDKRKAEEEERARAEEEERERRRRESWAARGGGRAAHTEDVFDPDEL